MIPKYNVTLNMKYWRANSPPKWKTLIYDLICVENNFYPATIKNDNGAVVTRIFFVQKKWKQQLHQSKERRHRGIEGLQKCSPIFLFFISIKLKAFHVTQNETPKMA